MPKKGYKLTTGCKKKINLSKRGRIMSEETKQKLSMKMKDGFKSGRIKPGMLGKYHTEEWKQKVSKSLKEGYTSGRLIPAKGMLGKIHSEKTKLKIKNGNINKHIATKESIQKMKETRKKLFKEHKEHPEIKQKISNTLKETYKKHPELIEKMKQYKGEKASNWQGGIAYYPYSVDWTKTLKKSIRKRDKYTCQICKTEPAIDVHHIDYNKKNCNINNLITLCHICHSKTGHNREHWKKIIGEMR